MTDAQCAACGYKERLQVVDLESDPPCPACKAGKLEPARLRPDLAASIDRDEFSHRLRTPLTVVKGSLQHLVKHWDALDERDRKVLVKAVLDQADLAIDAISNMEDRLSAADPRAAAEVEETARRS